MEMEKLINHLSKELEGFTVCKSEINPFKWNYSKTGVLQKEIKTNTVKPNNVPCFFKNDKRIKKINANLSREEWNTLITYGLTVGIIGNLTDCISTVTGEELDELLKIAELTYDDMSDITIGFEKIDTPLTLLFQNPTNNDYVMLLLILLIGTISVNCGSRHFSDGIYKKKKLSIKIEAYEKRLQEFVDYSLEHEILVIKDSSEETLAEAKKKIKEIYDNFLMTIVPIYTKYEIIDVEMEDAYQSIVSENKRLAHLSKESLEQVGKTFDTQTKLIAPKSILNNQPFMKIGNKSGDRLAILSNDQPFYNKLKNNLKALSDYQNDIWNEAYALRNAEKIVELEYVNSLTEEDIANIALGTLLAFADEDEALYKMKICKLAVGKVLEPLSGISIIAEEYDEEEVEEIISERGSLSEDKEMANDEPMNGDVPYLEIAYVGEKMSSYSKCAFKEIPTINKALVSKLEEIGVEHTTARELAAYTEGVKAVIKKDNKIFTSYASLCYASNKANEETNKNNKDDTREMEISRLKQEISRLSSRIKTGEKETQALQHELIAIKKEKEEYKAQVEKLSEQLKKTENIAPVRDETSKVIEDTVSPFPYTGDEKIVVAGGRQSFLDKVKEYFPNARYVPLAIHYDENIFRNADYIFIQINYISHSSYYKIVDTAKKSGVTVHHLNYASADRCAEEMLRKIKEEKENG